jgi:hypothetical protein
VVAVGRWWRDAPTVEIDAAVLQERGRMPVLLGESTARVVDG